uniref:Ufd2P_core domain-containing protein n=1 Tax=Macrostomum lignano TaxID=282301 RepID=A0A1I8F3Z2_9PLAT
SSPRRQRAGASTGLFLCRLLHDSLTWCLSRDDSCVRLPDLCLRVQPGLCSDFQRQLDFLVDSTRPETSAFTHACAAFSFVTLPSLDEPGLRCQLYLESAQVALLNQCYGQADALLKEAIRLLLQLLAKPHQQLAAAAATPAASAAPLTLLTGLVNGLCASPPPVGDEPTTCQGSFMRHLLIELDNLATAPNWSAGAATASARRLRDLRLGLLCGLADHCDLTAPDTAALFGQLWQLTAASIDGGGDVQQARGRASPASRIGPRSGR